MSGDDTINMTGQADYVYAGEGVDIVFGNDGDDYLWGEDGDDVLHGGDGDDRIYAGDDDDTAEGGSGDDLIEGGEGRDILVGGAGSDQIYGGDGNDLIMSGEESGATTAYDHLYGGEGDDIIICQTGSLTFAEGGAGADQFYIQLNSTGIPFGTSLEIEDSDPEDTIYWNGYQLLGGETRIIDFEISGQDYDWWAGPVDSNGVLYFLSGDELEISLPDGGSVIIYDFEMGDFGIFFDSFYDSASLTVQRDGNDNIVSWISNVPFSNIVLDNSLYNVADLAGASTAVANHGPFSDPIFPLI